MLTSKKKLGLLSIGALVCFMGLFFVTAPALAKEKPKGHATIVISNTFCMKLGDPHTWSGGPGCTLGYSLHQGLAMAEPGKPTLHKQPALAKSWKFSPDYKTVSFTLDKRAKFHNGEPVTAEDVKFSYERVMSPVGVKHVYRKKLKHIIASIKVIDKYNIVFQLKKRYPVFVDHYCNFVSIIPKAYTEKVGDAEFAKHPIGAGPFKWIDGKQDRYIKLEAFEDYFRKVPYVKTLDIKLVIEPSTALAMLKTGEADAVMLASTSHIPVVEEDPDLRIMWAKYSFMLGMLFVDMQNLDKKSPWHDKRVRQAMVYALDHETITKKLLNGAATPHGDILAPYQPGYDPSVKAPVYDPRKAKRLLAEAGYPNGFETTLASARIGQMTMMSQAIAASLRKVGIKTKVNVIEMGTLMKQYFTKKIDGNLLLWSVPYWEGEVHPVIRLVSIGSPKVPWTYVITPEIEASYNKLCQATKEADIAAAARSLSKLYRDKMLKAMLWASHTAYGVGPRVESWKRNAGVSSPTGLEYLKLKD